jgi:hypothetical protein
VTARAHAERRAPDGVAAPQDNRCLCSCCSMHAALADSLVGGGGGRRLASLSAFPGTSHC